jgi:hypothetical protein
MITASIWRLCHGSNGKTARRFLLPYSIINFTLSVIYVTLIIVAGGIAKRLARPWERSRRPAKRRRSGRLSARLSSSQFACHRAVELALTSYLSTFYASSSCLLLIFVPPATPCTSHSGWNPGEYEPAHPGGSPHRVRSGLRPAPTQPLVS